MIKAIIARGIGFTLGTISYIPTHGFGIGAAVVAQAGLAALSDASAAGAVLTDEATGTATIGES